MKFRLSIQVFLLGAVVYSCGLKFTPSLLAQNAPKAPPTDAQATTPKPTPAPLTAKDVITQGVQLYRKGKFDLASKKFLAALKLEPNNDDALGYASLTAYQLGNQAQAHDLFQKRAELANQKSSVKLFCTYMAALTSWRQAHEIVAKRGEINGSRTVYKLNEKELMSANESIAAGLSSVNKALEMKSDYAEAVNVKNLLHAEAAAIAGEDKAAEQQKEALKALRQALKLHREGTDDFGSPTLRIGEFGATEEEQSQLKDDSLAHLEGGRPVTRATAVLPIIKIAPGKTKSQGDDPAPTGVGTNGGAISLGPGQGALRPSKTEVMKLKGGKAKVEVLVSSTGNVVFARIIDGPPVTTGAALAAAKKWTFSPPKFEEHPVQVLGVITFDVQPGSDKSKSKSTAQPPKDSSSKKTAPEPIKR